MSLWTKIKGWIVSESEIVVNFLKPFALTIEKGGEAILITAAENAVTVGFATAGAPEVKMIAALAAFAAEVAEKGLPYIESQARALIEVALQNAKATDSPVLEAAAGAGPTPA